MNIPITGSRSNGRLSQRLIKALVVISVLAIFFVACTLIFGKRFLALYMVNFTIVPILGKFAPIVALDPGLFTWLDPSFDFSPWEIGAIVGLGDMCMAFLLTHNLDLAYSIPKLGPVLETIEKKSVEILKIQPWIGRMTFIGMVAFVVFPLSGTGAIGGSIFSRLLGLSPWRAFLAISLGGFIGGFAFTGLVVIFGKLVIGFIDPGVAVAGGSVLILAIIWILNKRYRQAVDAKN
ncbi:MAG: small multi-drug export protein [Deltaproteobacteria bacterium]|nr:small multi-drug export protein [Deltaproteobacteria bacterium]